MELGHSNQNLTREDRAGMLDRAEALQIHALQKRLNSSQIEIGQNEMFDTLKQLRNHYASMSLAVGKSMEKATRVGLHNDIHRALKAINHQLDAMRKLEPLLQAGLKNGKDPAKHMQELNADLFADRSAPKVGGNPVQMENIVLNTKKELYPTARSITRNIVDTAVRNFNVIDKILVQSLPKMKQAVAFQQSEQERMLKEVHSNKELIKKFAEELRKEALAGKEQPSPKKLEVNASRLVVDPVGDAASRPRPKSISGAYGQGKRL